MTLPVRLPVTISCPSPRAGATRLEVLANILLSSSYVWTDLVPDIVEPVLLIVVRTLVRRLGLLCRLVIAPLGP